MLVAALLLVLLLPALFVVIQLASALGAWRGVGLGALVLLVLGGAWGALEWTRRREPPPLPEDLTASQPIPAQACAKCHPSHYASWQRTFHRTMTREATPEFVKGDFNNAVHEYLGVTSRMIRVDDRFFIDTVDPEWSRQMALAGKSIEQAGPGPRRMLAVDRLVGSHWFQHMLHRDDDGRYVRLPLAYHIVEGRWVHINGAFLAPSETRYFFGKSTVWNETCVFCHNTRPNKNPQKVLGQLAGYRTEVAELGIACEACHGAGEQHVRAHQNPARRLVQRYADEADPTIVNPARLSAARADDICARCHGEPLPTWNRDKQADPFFAGQELGRFNNLFWSEDEMRRLAQRQSAALTRPQSPEALDGRFWGDGTPLTTGLEYQGLSLSACYQNGHGELRCITCHSLHQSDPNHQVKEGMRTNAACYSCHDTYRTRLVEHTHHAANSPGSLCYNCHMPHQVYSLLDTHRSHRIAVPRVRDSVGTGKPHACNLCHLDKSLGWTQDNLAKWYGTRPEPLGDDDRKVASSVLHLTQSDARTRAIVAGAFGSPAAQQTSGRDWPALLLTRALDHERYEAVRYLEHRALRSLYGPTANDYNYQGTAAERAAQLRALRLRLESTARPQRGRYPYLPLTAEGLFADDVYDRLLRTRKDPDVTINE